MLPRQEQNWKEDVELNSFRRTWRKLNTYIQSEMLALPVKCENYGLLMFLLTLNRQTVLTSRVLYCSD